MDLIKCKAFLVSVDTGSLTSAALEMSYTPSGITRMINSLESELGFTLLNRNPKGISLTENGKRMLPFIREIVHYNEQVSQVSAEIRELLTGTLNVGTYPSIAACWLPEIIKRFNFCYPGIHINVLEGGNTDFVSWLRKRRIDCCFITNRKYEGDWVKLMDDKFMAWLPEAHPWQVWKNFR